MEALYTPKYTDAALIAKEKYEEYRAASDALDALRSHRSDALRSHTHMIGTDNFDAYVEESDKLIEESHKLYAEWEDARNKRDNTIDGKKKEKLEKQLEKFLTPNYFDVMAEFDIDMDYFSHDKVNNLTHTIDGNTAVVTVVFESGASEKIDLVKLDGKWKIAPPREFLDSLKRYNIFR